VSKNIDADLMNGLEAYKDHIINDYAQWKDNSAVAQRMMDEFRSSVEFSFASKYVKIVTGTQRSAHSFVALKDIPATKNTPAFKKGDILKAASWAAPAKNFPRGNILTDKGKFPNVRWTGA